MFFLFQKKVEIQNEFNEYIYVYLLYFILNIKYKNTNKIYV